MSNDNQTERSSSPLLMIVGLLLAVVLLGAGLFLTFGQQYLTGGDSAAEPANNAASSGDSAGSGDADNAGAANVGDEFGIDANGDSLSLSTMTGIEFGQQLPADTELKTSVYVIDGADGSAESVMRLRAPDGVEARLLDVYGWDGNTWSFIPSQFEAGTLVTANTVIPQAVVAVQANRPTNVALGLEVLPTGEVPGALFPIVNEISVGTLTLGGDGELMGVPMLIQPGNYREYLRVTNTGLVVDTLSLTNILSNAQLQSQHINEMVSQAFNGGFAGVNLDYQGATPAQSAAFTTFVSSLDSALAAQNLSLVVTVEAPALVNGQWQVTGQDWEALSGIADMIYLQMPLNPTAWGDGGLAEQTINYATRRINRHKLSLLVSANSVDQVGETYLEMPSSQALSNFGELQLLQGGESVNMGEPIEMGLSGTASALEWDGAGVTYKYTYEQSGINHTVWLGNEGALAHRMRLADRYNLRGVMVRGLGGIADGRGYTAAYNSLLGQEAPTPQAAALVWTVASADGNVVASNTGSDAFTFAYQDTTAPGDFTLNVDFALGDNQTNLGSYAFSVVDGAAIAAATAEAEAVAQAAAEAEAAEVAAAEANDDAGDDTASSSGIPGVLAIPAGADTNLADGFLTIETNFRSGPGFYYSVQNILDVNMPLAIIGRTNDNSWLNVAPVGTDKQGWVFSDLVRLKPGFDINTVRIAGQAVASAPAAQPTQPPQPTQVWPTGTPLPQGVWATATPKWVPPTATPVWVPPTPIPATATPAVVDNGGGGGGGIGPANLSGGFELGGQTHTLASPSLMKDIGMNWVKFQHKWSSGDTGQAIADRVANAKGQGFKVLMSMPGSNTYPSSIDAAGYVNFLRSVAQLNPAPDAIEIWNEMNIDFEWPAGQISPSDYVNTMLKPGYQAIKAANPSIIVVSGAPAPTGFDNGTNAWADDRYMAGVAAAGGGNYMDCIGVHYNAGATSPNQNSGHPADGGARHYSWYFAPTMNMYYNSFGGARKVCFTELGYVSSDGFSHLPPNFNWAANTSVGEHAQWLSEAVSLSSNSGKVRMLIIFNVDFTHYDQHDPQAGYALVRPNGSCPACPLIKSVMGR